MTVPELEIQGKRYSNHQDQPGREADTLRIPPSLAKDAWLKGQVHVLKGGATDNFKIQNLNLFAYRPWLREGEQPSGQPRDEFWLRCRLVKHISLAIEGLSYHKGDFGPEDFFYSGALSGKRPVTVLSPKDPREACKSGYLKKSAVSGSSIPPCRWASGGRTVSGR